MVHSMATTHILETNCKWMDISSRTHTRSPFCRSIPGSNPFYVLPRNMGRELDQQIQKRWLFEKKVLPVCLV